MVRQGTKLGVVKLWWREGLPCGPHDIRLKLGIKVNGILNISRIRVRGITRREELRNHVQRMC